MTLLSIFEQQKQAFLINSYPSISERRNNLLLIKRLLQEHAMQLCAAVNQDFSHRAKEETLILELFPTINIINYCLKNLKKWTKPQKRHVSWHFKPAKAYTIAQPLGVVGVIAPWNYPIYLALAPLVCALSAGNMVMIKCSEFTPVTGKALELLFSQNAITRKIITVVNGDISVAEEFAALPFAHLLFTGSTATGKHIMAAASKHLTPLTLELGGKSPTIISQSANPQYFDRLFMGKLLNAGQTCVAPDYLLVHKNFVNQIEQAMQKFIDKHYPQLINNKNYSNVISIRHKERLLNMLNDAQEKGARIVQFGENSIDCKLPIYLIFNVNESMQLMREEIFGPLLPILTYESFNEALNIINSMPNPLALYYFGADANEIKLLQFNTLSGALTINDTIMHIAIDDLPFGGVGQSGFGQYHGQEGFATFSKLKPVFIQKKISLITWLYPPYGKLLHYFLRYFAGIKVD